MMVSSEGATSPLWAPNGSAIYFQSGTTIMRASAAADGSFSPPEALFDRPNLVFVGAAGESQRAWDIDPTGTHFVTVEVVADEDDAPQQGGTNIIIVANWFEELKQRMGSN